MISDEPINLAQKLTTFYQYIDDMFLVVVVLAVLIVVVIVLVDITLVDASHSSSSSDLK